jgi:hypothetical protein
MIGQLHGYLSEEQNHYWASDMTPEHDNNQGIGFYSLVIASGMLYGVDCYVIKIPLKRNHRRIMYYF